MTGLVFLPAGESEPVEAPRLRGTYRYRCYDRHCRGHKQGMLDWEFVALQDGLRGW